MKYFSRLLLALFLPLIATAQVAVRRGGDSMTGGLTNNTAAGFRGRGELTNRLGSLYAPTNQASMYDITLREAVTLVDVTTPVAKFEPNNDPDDGFVSFIGQLGGTPTFTFGVGVNNAGLFTAPSFAGSGSALTGDNEVYGVGWNGDITLPTKDAVYDKIETISGGGNFSTNASGDAVFTGTVTLGPLFFALNAGAVNAWDGVTDSSTANSDQSKSLSLNGIPYLKWATSTFSSAGADTNKNVTIPYGVSFSPLGNTNYPAYAVGTAYTVTTTAALADFGTTDPTITILQTGTYELSGAAVAMFNAATYVAAQTLTVKLRRTNNTAADIANAVATIELPVLTTFTGGDCVAIPTVEYSATAGDIIQVFVSYTDNPGAGTVTITAPGTWLRAKRIN